MLKVGLTGGYASGKSFAAAELSRLGCHVLYADRLGHQVLEPGGEAFGPVVSQFGGGILFPDGTINRKKLAELVFPAPPLLEKLTAIVHPAVFRLEERMLADFSAADPQGIAVIEAAILIETGRYARFDRLIVTACDLETQIARGMRRDGLTREQVLARVEKQMPTEEKKRLAHYVIETGASEENTLRQVRAVFAGLKQLAEASLA